MSMFGNQALYVQRKEVSGSYFIGSYNQSLGKAITAVIRKYNDIVAYPSTETFHM